MGKAIELSEVDFDAVVMKSEVPVLVDFWSPTCGPCRAVAPILDQLVDEYGEDAKFVKINIFDNTGVAARLGVDMLPTLIIFDHGQMVERLTGAQSKDALMDLLDEYV